MLQLGSCVKALTPVWSGGLVIPGYFQFVCFNTLHILYSIHFFTFPILDRALDRGHLWYPTPDISEG